MALKLGSHPRPTQIAEAFNVGGRWAWSPAYGCYVLANVMFLSVPSGEKKMNRFNSFVHLPEAKEI